MWTTMLEVIAKNSRMSKADRERLADEAGRIFDLGQKAKAEEIRDCLMLSADTQESKG